MDIRTSLYVIRETQRGVLLKFGEVVDPDLKPGIHLKIPFVNNVRKFDDLGSDGVALLREYLELMPAGVLPRLKAEFVVYLFCVRMGNPKGKLQSFAIDPDGAGAAPGGAALDGAG